MKRIMGSKNSNRIKQGSLAADVVIYLMAAAFALLTLYPMYYVLILSVSDPQAALTMKVYAFPKGFYLGGYQRILSDSRLWLSYRNTIMYASVMTAVMLTTCTCVAYPLTSPMLIGRKFINMFLMIPMYISGGLIPTFILMTKINLYGSPFAVILLGSYSIWYIILVRSYFASIPETLREAARIDGANSYRILWNIYLPNSKPILAVIALYTIISAWNSWYNATIYLPQETWQPLQLFLRRVLVESSVNLAVDAGATEAEMIDAVRRKLGNEQIKYALIIVSTLPMLVIYPFFQKYFVKGIMLGSVKG